MTTRIDQFNLSDRIAHLRKLRNMTQQELADKAGLSQSTIAQIESVNVDKDPSIETLIKISKALDVHIAILFAGDNVHVFDMNKLREKYNHVTKLHPTIYHALGMVVAYAKEIEFLK